MNTLKLIILHTENTCSLCSPRVHVWYFQTMTLITYSSYYCTVCELYTPIASSKLNQTVCMFSVLSWRYEHHDTICFLINWREGSLILIGHGVWDTKIKSCLHKTLSNFRISVLLLVISLELFPVITITIVLVISITPSYFSSFSQLLVLLKVR